MLQAHATELHPLGQHCEDVSRTLGACEDVDIDVPRAAGFERAIGKRDRAPDRVRNPRRVERVVNRKQLIAELTHERRRINGGYSSSDRGR